MMKEPVVARVVEAGEESIVDLILEDLEDVPINLLIEDDLDASEHQIEGKTIVVSTL